MSIAELDQELRRIRTEVGHQAIMSLVASVEALLQDDLLFKGKGKEKRPRAYKKLRKRAKRKRDRVTLDDLLDSWKGATDAAALGEFKQVVRFRHWVAHGKYWRQASGLQQLLPGVAWDRSAALLCALSGFPDANAELAISRR